MPQVPAQVPAQYLLSPCAPSPRTLIEVLYDTAARYPDAAAIDDGTVQLTYSELISDIEASVAWLAARGIGRGDRIGIRMPSGSFALYEAILATLAFGLMGMIPGSLGMYTAENYPNHLRALGNGATSVSQRLSSVISPTLVGLILPSYGVGGVYGMFAVFAIVGGVTCALFSIETAGKTLEELSPSPAPAATA